MRATSAAAAVGAVLTFLTIPAAANAASGGYGPTAATGPANVPGGFSAVAAAKTVDASGGTLSVDVPGGSVNVTAPAGAFSQPVQIKVTEPSLPAVTGALPALGFGGYSAVAGIGIKVFNTDGSAMTGTFGKAITVTLTGSGLGAAGEEVVSFDTAHSVTVLPAHLAAGHVTFTVTADPDIAVVNPAGHAVATGTVVGATTVHTGKPFTAERGLAGLLAVAGAAALVTTRRRSGTAG